MSIAKRKLCPENWSRSYGYGNNAMIQGPHHWVRVGTWADVWCEYRSNDGCFTSSDGKTWEQAQPDMVKFRVDRPVYECVYCLEGKRQEREKPVEAE